MQLGELLCWRSRARAVYIPYWMLRREAPNHADLTGLKIQ